MTSPTPHTCASILPGNAQVSDGGVPHSLSRQSSNKSLRNRPAVVCATPDQTPSYGQDFYSDGDIPQATGAAAVVNAPFTSPPPTGGVVDHTPRHFYAPLDLARMEAAILSKAHGFLVHKGHTTSAAQLQPLVQAARNAVMVAENEARRANA